MAPSSPQTPVDPIALCADATWQCAVDLRLDGLQAVSNGLAGADLSELRGRRLDELAAKAIYGEQTEALLGCLGDHRSIRDATLSVVNGAGRIRNYLLNAAPKVDDQGNFRGYFGSLRVWDEVPFAEHRKGEIIESLRQADVALEKEARLRHEADLLLAALQILIEPSLLQDKCARLFEIFGPTLDFDQAVVLRRGLRAKMTVAASSETDVLGLEWPEEALPKSVMAGETRFVEGDDLDVLTGGLTDPLCGARAALFVPLGMGAETAVLVALGRNQDRSMARHISLMQRLSLIATKAFQEEDQKTALVASSKLAAMGELLATIAHEVNQPVTIISMSASNGRMLLADGAPAEDLDAKLERIEAQARRAGEIVQAVRHLSFVDRLSTGSETIDLREALKTVETIARIGLEKREITLSVDLDEACPRVQGQASWLQQVVLNLVTNARDAIVDRLEEDPDCGPGQIRIVVAQAGEEIALTVADNGGGVPEDLREKIFDPFFTLKQQGKGNGLGLALCRRLISDMGGRITLRNDDQGAVFEIRLLPAGSDAGDRDLAEAPRLATG